MCLLLPQTAPPLRALQKPTWRRGRRRRRSPRPAPSPRACWRPATLLRRSLCHPSARAKASPRWSFGRRLAGLTHCSARRSNVKVEQLPPGLLVMSCRVRFWQTAPEPCFSPGARCASGTWRPPADSSCSPCARSLRASPCQSTRSTCPRVGTRGSEPRRPSGRRFVLRRAIGGLQACALRVGLVLNLRAGAG